MEHPLLQPIPEPIATLLVEGYQCLGGGDLDAARQILLRYGDACLVHEPAELVELFRTTTTGLARLYGPP